jgi:CRP/FNR family transcriptional regulator
MARDMRRSRDLIMLLGSMCAEERLATFLLDLSERHRARGFSGNDLVLRMTRAEIASFLGLKLETVSRVFSRLHEEGLLLVQGRAVRLLDPQALERIAGHRA